MDTNTNEERERLLGFEIMRLMEVSREHVPETLLDAALNGREKTAASVAKLFGFVLRTYGETTGNTPSRVTAKYWDACSAFLTDAGLTPEQLENIRHPFPLAGEPGFESILDEMHEKGLD